MPPNSALSSVHPCHLIPDPLTVRHRLGVVRAEVRLLARLLRVAEDRVRILPTGAAADSSNGSGAARRGVSGD